MEDIECMCGHKGPDREGEHTGVPYAAGMKRCTCVHPGCNCKGFATVEDVAGFMTDENLGGP